MHEGLRPRRQRTPLQQCLHFLQVSVVAGFFQAGQQPVSLGMAAAQLQRRRQFLFRKFVLAQVNKVVGIVDAQGGVVGLALGCAPVPFIRRAVLPEQGVGGADHIQYLGNIVGLELDRVFQGDIGAVHLPALGQQLGEVGPGSGVTGLQAGDSIEGRLGGAAIAAGQADQTHQEMRGNQLGIALQHQLAAGGGLVEFTPGQGAKAPGHQLAGINGWNLGPVAAHCSAETLAVWRSGQNKRKKRCVLCRRPPYHYRAGCSTRERRRYPLRGI